MTRPVLSLWRRLFADETPKADSLERFAARVFVALDGIQADLVKLTGKVDAIAPKRKRRKAAK